VSPNGRYAAVISADDNSLLILDIKSKLSPVQLYKNKENRNFKLEGASGLVFFDKGSTIAVASFYDSAVSLFKRQTTFKFDKAYSNGLSYQRIFKSDVPVTNEDTLGLLGAWDIVITPDEQHLFVAGYKSNAVSAFTLSDGGIPAFKQKITGETLHVENLGNPVALAYSDKRNELIVAGFDGNQLSVIAFDNDRKASLKQSINNHENTLSLLVNPQKLLLSHDQQYLYAACSGSSAILMFENTDTGYQYRQTITHKDIAGHGLKGIASLALSHNGRHLFAGAEFDEGLLHFGIKQNGQLEFKQRIQSNTHKIAGITSIAMVNDTDILLTLGKLDSVYLLKIKGL